MIIIEDNSFSTYSRTKVKNFYTYNYFGSAYKDDSSTGYAGASREEYRDFWYFNTDQDTTNSYGLADGHGHRGNGNGHGKGSGDGLIKRGGTISYSEG